jgi:hypothetical protein
MNSSALRCLLRAAQVRCKAISCLLEASRAVHHSGGHDPFMFSEGVR